MSMEVHDELSAIFVEWRSSVEGPSNVVGWKPRQERTFVAILIDPV
jgi:hypothetical protein